MRSQIKTFQICLLFMALTSLSLLGCGDLKKINDVKESTDAVKKGIDLTGAKLDKVDSSLNRVASNTDQFTETAKGILKSTTAAETSLRNVESGVNNSNQSLNEILSTAQQDAERKEKLVNTQARAAALESLKQATSLKERYSIARTYFLAFDFQSFKSKAIEARPAEYNLRLVEGVKELFLTAGRFGASDYSVDPGAQPSKRYWDEDNQSIFNALALSLHEKAPDISGAKADEQSNEGKRPLSLLDVIVRALNQRTDIQRGALKLEEVPEHLKIVLMNEERATQMLQARHNGFAVRLSGELFGYEEMWLIGRILTWARPSISVNLDESSFNLIRLKKIETEILLPALENKRWMIRIGKRPEFVSKIRDLVMKLEISTAGKMSGDVQVQRKRIIDLYKDYISETNAYTE